MYIPIIISGLLCIFLIYLKFKRHKNLKQHLNLSSLPQLLIDRAGKVLLVNTSFQQWLGPLNAQFTSLSPLICQDELPYYQTLLAIFHSNPETANSQIWIQLNNQRVLLSLSHHPQGTLVTIAPTDQPSVLPRLNAADLFEHSLIGIGILNLHGQFTHINARMQAIIGYSEAWLLGKCFYHIGINEGPQDLSIMLTELMRTKNGSHASDKCYLRPNQQPVWVHRTILLVRDTQGTPLHFISTVIDITQLKTAKMQLKESELKFRTITEMLEDCIYYVTPGASKMLYVNPAYEKIWGRSCASLYENPRGFLDAIIDEDKERVYSHMEEHANGTWDIQYGIEHPQHGRRYILDKGVGVRDHQGHLKGLVGIAKDITDLVTRQQEVIKALNHVNQLNHKLEQQTQTDPMTGALNRLGLFPLLTNSIQLYEYHQRSASLLFIDVDHFKAFNDNYSHAIGDLALITVTKKLKELLRSSDYLARIAGDEFVVLLPGTGLAGAEKLRHAFSTMPISIDTGNSTQTNIYISVGLKTLNPSIRSADEWIHAADEAMYLDKAKHHAAVLPSPA